MDATVHGVASRMNSLSNTLDSIAFNLANTETPGFKSVIGKFEAVEIPRTSSGQPRVFVTSWDPSSVDMSPGSIIQTNRPLDLAIKGEAFFALDTPEGPRYTRRGRMYLDPTGDLVDPMGNRFVAVDGAMNIPPDATDLAVKPHGEILADGEPIGKISLVKLDADSLVRESNGIYRNEGDPPEEDIESSLVQGAIEGSNVNPVKEMVRMIEVMRAYENSSQMLRRIDEARKGLLREIG